MVKPKSASRTIDLSRNLKSRKNKKPKDGKVDPQGSLLPASPAFIGVSVSSPSSSTRHCHGAEPCVADAPAQVEDLTEPTPRIILRIPLNLLAPSSHMLQRPSETCRSTRSLSSSASRPARTNRPARKPTRYPCQYKKMDNACVSSSEVPQSVSGPLQACTPKTTQSDKRKLPQLDLDLFAAAQSAVACSLDQTVSSIQLGGYELEVLGQSRYPMEEIPERKLYICEFCLDYTAEEVSYTRHMLKCPRKCPPGREIYRKDQLSVFEVDGSVHKIYAQNLCLLAILFLEQKTLFRDVDPFLFYIMTEADSHGCHMTGYFSKGKDSLQNNNLSCLLVLPQHMRKGYGRLLIDFSYLLSRKEGKIGTPERPLSDMGLISYRSYWTEVLMQHFLSCRNSDRVSIREISQKTSVHPNDLISTLQLLGLIKKLKDNYVIVKREKLLMHHAEKRKNRTLNNDPNCLHWSPSTESDSKR